jgi:hypothetical protein
MARTCSSALGPRLLGVAQQRVAAERNADGDDRSAMQGAKAPEQPAHLFPVARVVGARRQIELARAAAKVRHREAPAAGLRIRGEGFGVVTRRGAFESMEQNEQGGAVVAAEPVDVDEVAIRRRPALALEPRPLAGIAAAEEHRPDRLHMATRQPARGAKVMHRVRRGN